MSLPPESLPAPPSWLRLALTPLWLGLALFAIVSQLGGSWQTYANHYYYNPPFAAIGIESYNGYFISGRPQIEATSDIPPDTALLRIGDREVSPMISYPELSAMLDGPMGTSVSLGIELPDGTMRDIELMRSEATYHLSSPRWLFVVDRILLPILGALAAGFGLFVSHRLWRRQDDPVAQLLAFGIIGLILTGLQTFRFVDGLTQDQVIVAGVFSGTYLFAFTCLILAIPAFPDGRYWPRWSGWLVLVTPLLALAVYAFLMFVLITANEALYPYLWVISWRLFIPLTLVAVAAAYLRFRATPAGLEKQQTKWAAFGIVFGLLLIAFAEGVLGNITIDGPAQLAIGVAYDLIRALGIVVLPLGLLMSMLGLRLNDADGAIGRSAGYALITLLIGALWTAGTTWINRLVGDQLSPAAAAGISTMIAAAIFVPTRERILTWTEKRFQPALVKLRGLPAKLLPWRSDHDPADVARGTLLAIVNGVQASSAALILDDEGDPRILATYEVDEQIALADIGQDDPDARAFPVHLKLDDLVGPIGFLLIGPRSDGASYNSDEKAAMKLVAGPLAEVLRATSRRAHRNLAFAEMLTAVDARVARLEALRATA